MGGTNVDRFLTVSDRFAGVVLNGFTRIVVHRPAGLGIEAGGPVHGGEGLTSEELAVDAIQGVVEAVPVGLPDYLAHLAADIDVVKLGDRHGVIIPRLVGDRLEVPL